MSRTSITHSSDATPTDAIPGQLNLDGTPADAGAGTDKRQRAPSKNADLFRRRNAAVDAIGAYTAVKARMGAGPVVDSLREAAIEAVKAI